MKRTTIFIEEQLERELRALAHRLDRPAAALVREAVERYVVTARQGGSRRLGFVAIGRSGHADTADRHEDLLWQEQAGGAGARTGRISARRAVRGTRGRRGPGGT